MSFLYEIICITDVWDPVANISKVIMAIVNRDDATCVAYVNSKDGTEFIDNSIKVGYLEAKSSVVGKKFRFWYKNYSLF